MEQPRERTLEEILKSTEELKRRTEEIKKQTAENLKKRENSDTTGIISIIFVFIIGFSIYQCTKSSSLGTPEENIKLNCAVLAENGIKENLKSPSTAEFNYSSGNYNDYVQLTSVTDSIFEVTGTCDAENSFGAKLRENFIVKIKKENNQLKIIDIKIN